MSIDLIRSIIYDLSHSSINYFEFKNNNIILKAIKNNQVKSAHGTTYDEISCTRYKDEFYTIVSEYVGVVTMVDTQSGLPFVSMGDVVKNGTLLCLIKYLNLSIDIYSPIDGYITEICVENNSIVDYGKIIYKISIK